MTTIPPNPEEALVTISTPTSDTVRVRDRVESSRFEFYFDDDVGIREVSTESLFFPVDIATRIRNSGPKMVIPMASALFIRNHDTGEIVRRTNYDVQEVAIPDGVYEIEITSAPIKLYLYIEGAVSIHQGNNQITLDISEAEPVILGVRSHHEKPAGTITTTEDTRSVMRAVSCFGSALKTTSPERSWPTLRGYPPELEIGEQYHVPESIERHAVDVRLEIPESLPALFQTAPLAYYSCAEVVPLPVDERTPGIVAAGTRIELPGNLGTAAASLLRDQFMLDAVIRSEGLYPFETEERRTIEERLPWDIETVYELPLGERIAVYQEVPESVTKAIEPIWPLTADVEATRTDIPLLTHLAEELAIVRVPDQQGDQLTPQPAYLSEFVRADGGAGTSVQRTTGEAATEAEIQRPLDWDSQIHTSLKDEYPLGSNKTSLRSYERHIERESPDASTIEVNVICNDDEMREEDVVTEFYGVRDLLEFDVNIHYNLSVAELRELLAETFDFAHYIGHIDTDGIMCKDGYLDARTLNEVGMDAFLLNACRSVEQGEALLEAGAIGGIATLYDVPNSSATRLGRTLSRLLNRGFTIRSALELARESSYLSSRWVSLGDGRISLTQAESGVPSVADVEPVENGFRLHLEWFETVSHRTGSLVTPNTDWGGDHVLPSSLDTHVTEEQLEEWFALEVSPIRCSGNLYWTDEVSPAELRERHGK